MQAQPQPEAAPRAGAQFRVHGERQPGHGTGQQRLQGESGQVGRPAGGAVLRTGVGRAQPGRAGGQFPQAGQVARLRGGQHHPSDQPARCGRVARPVVRVVVREEGPGVRPPPAPVVLVAQRQLARVHAQLAVEELGPRPARQPFLPGVQQDGVGRAAGARAGLPVVDARAVQRDRQPPGGPADVPDVHPVRDQGDARGGGPHARGEDEVLVGEAAVGEADAVLAQEGRGVELVDAEGVVDQARAARRAREHGGRGVQVRLPRHLAPRGQLPPYAQTARDLGARPGRRGEQGVHRAGREDVVAVQEHHVGRGHRVEPGVARGAAAAAVDGEADHPQARLVGGQPVQQIGAAVRRAVVDGDDLAHGGPLSEGRAHGVGHVGGVVVADDHDGDLGVVGVHGVLGAYGRFVGLLPVRGRSVHVVAAVDEGGGRRTADAFAPAGAPTRSPPPRPGPR